MEGKDIVQEIQTKLANARVSAAEAKATAGQVQQGLEQAVAQVPLDQIPLSRRKDVAGVLTTIHGQEQGSDTAYATPPEIVADNHTKDFAAQLIAKAKAEDKKDDEQAA